MKIFYTNLISLFILLSSITITSANEGRKEWSSTSFEQKVFVENNGQFNEEIIFGASSTGVTILFSKNGLKYEYTELKKLSEEEIDTLVKECISSTGASSIKDMSNVMEQLKNKTAGRADMAAVGAKVKALLN